MANDTMSISIEAGEDADLAELLEAFHESGAVGGTEIIDLKAKTSETSFVGSGMAEITQLVVVLGSSGAIAALTTILSIYFRNRQGTLKWMLDDGERQETIEVSSKDPSVILAFLERHRPVRK